MDLPCNNPDVSELAGMKDDDQQFGYGMQVARFVFADPTTELGMQLASLLGQGKVSDADVAH